VCWEIHREIAEGDEAGRESELHVILMQNNNFSNAHPSRVEAGKSKRVIRTANETAKDEKGRKCNGKLFSHHERIK
jgi:hypothetical protein